MKENEEQKNYDPREAYVLFSAKLQLKFEEFGEQLVRITNGYINEGLMDFEQAMMFLNGVLNQDEQH